MASCAAQMKLYSILIGLHIPDICKVILICRIDMELFWWWVCWLHQDCLKRGMQVEPKFGSVQVRQDRALSQKGPLRSCFSHTAASCPKAGTFVFSSWRSSLPALTSPIRLQLKQMGSISMVGFQVGVQKGCHPSFSYHARAWRGWGKKGCFPRNVLCVCMN